MNFNIITPVEILIHNFGDQIQGNQQTFVYILRTMSEKDINKDKNCFAQIKIKCI